MPKVLNRERLRRKLFALAPEIKKGIHPALEKGAQEIVDLAIHLVPVDTGALRNSIDWTWGQAPKGAISGARGLRAGGLSDLKSDLLITVYAGNELAYYARWVEFGTSAGQRAQPFFFPAYRALRKSVKNRIARAAVTAIRKVASGRN